VKPKPKSTRPTAHELDIAGITAALTRASLEARRITKAAGVPFWVWQDGKVVDLNAKRTPRRSKKRSPRKPN